jgi:hypothetical protein
VRVRSAPHLGMKRLRTFGRTLVRLLNELSDQNAYRRHLSAHGRPHSREEWRLFCEHRFDAKYRRPKCC